MKGVILAGGRGSRLYPLTKVVNKNILPVYDQPLIYYPLFTLKNAGIEDILIISGPDHSGHFADLLEDGGELGVRLSYTIQKDPLGIAHALSLAEEFAGGESIALVLGDNVYEDDLRNAVEDFLREERGAKIIIKEVPDPHRFGVVAFSKDRKRIVDIEEKPANPKTNFIITGFYVFDNRIFDIIKGLSPSLRGEYEITDALKWYMNEGTLTHHTIIGEWIDAGTFDSLLKANNFIAGKKRNERNDG